MPRRRTAAADSSAPGSPAGRDFLDKELRQVARDAAKLQLIQTSYGQGWSRQRLLDLFAVLDWMLHLPPLYERKLWLDLGEHEWKAGMRYGTSVERLAIEDGLRMRIARGQARTLARQLSRRFGPLPAEALAKLEQAPPNQLDLWTDRVLDAPTLQAVLEGN